jgi:acyl-CoA hydrolase
MPPMTDPDLAPDPTPRERTPKRVADSAVTLTQMMEVTDVNIAGTVHGGVIMRLVDTAAGLAAVRHAGGLAVTVAIDEMTFLEPVHIGDVLVLLATVNDVGTTSMECGVRVEAHDPVTGTMRHANSAYLVFVAVDDDGHPRPVPPLVVETDDEKRRQREAKLRRKSRLAHKEAVKAAREAEMRA